MEARLQRRVQRYGWDQAAVAYEPLWQGQLALAQRKLLECAAFVGGPVALAWSRFDDGVRARVRERYLEAIRPWHAAGRYAVPGQFVVVGGTAP